MISLKVTVKPDERRIAKLVKDLGYVSSETFTRSLPLRQYREQALDYLKDLFPTSTKSKSNTNEFGDHLVRGWKTEYIHTKTGVGFRLFHAQENNSRVQTVLKSLDKGSQFFTYDAEEEFRFFGRYASKKGKHAANGWITIAEGRTVIRGPRKGLNYAEKTSEYIQLVLLPQMRAMVQERVRSRIERGR